MPGLRGRTARGNPARAPEGPATDPDPPGRRSRQAALDRFFPRCGHPGCGNGRIRLWRSRRAPVFEGRWACSPVCLRAMVGAAVHREGRGEARAAGWTHRVPLRLMLLEQGRISEEQLRQAGRRPADREREAAELEEWLLHSGVLGEAALTRAISAQWNCPVFSLSATRPAEVAAAIPGFLAEALGALPVAVAGGRLLYLAFAQGIDRSLSYAVEHMTGLRVASGIARESEFRREQARFLAGRLPRARFLEARDRSALAQKMADWIEEERPIDARLARVHEQWWLRIWRREEPATVLPACEAVEDLLAIVSEACHN